MTKGFKYFKFAEPLRREFADVIVLQEGLKWRFYDDKRKVSGLSYKENNFKLLEIVAIYLTILRLKDRIDSKINIERQANQFIEEFLKYEENIEDLEKEKTSKQEALKCLSIANNELALLHHGANDEIAPYDDLHKK